MAVHLEKEVVTVNNIPTVVSRILPKSEAYSVVIVVIPGNPGLVEFYDEFITTLFDAIGGSCPVYGISHAGHSPTGDYPRNKCLDGNVTRTHNSPFSLEDQINHKKIFLEEHIPLHLKIILVGHSIGAYVILNILKKCQRTEDVRKAILLFPTLERMAVSPSGRYVTPMVTYFRWLAVGAAAAFSVLPEFVKRGLVRWWLSDEKQPNAETVDSVIKLLTPTSINGCATMARDEMFKVVHLDEQVIAQNLKKLIFYYGASDHWAPVSYYEDMKTKFPDGEIYLCQRDFKHAFVLESSVDVARMVAAWIQEIT